MASHQFGENIDIEETAAGEYRITHTPSGQTAVLGPDGWKTDVTETDELSVKDSSPVTGGPVGNEGEFITLKTITLPVNRLSTTSVTWTQAGLNPQRVTVALNDLDLTNISNIYAKFSAQVHGDTTGQNFHVRAHVGGSLPETEVITTSPSFDRITSSLGLIDDALAIDYPRWTHLEFKVSEGSAEIYSTPTITILGEIT